MATPRKTTGTDRRERPKARTPEERENQLVSLAFDVAEKQMLEGTVSATVMVHWLKLGTARSKLEEEKLRKENILLEARANDLGSSKEAEARYAEAVRAIRSYQGMEPEEDDEDV